MWGGPAGAQLGFMLGSAVGGYVDPQKIEGPRLTDAQTQTSNEGLPRPIVYGTAAVAGNIVQCGPLVEHKTTERSGKGGPKVTTYTYTRTLAIRICEAAPLGGAMKLRRVWMDDKLVYDVSGTGVIDGDSAKFKSILRFYSGDETQLPDPSLEALPAENGGGVGNLPSYRGTCYAVLTDLDCTDRQGAVPQFRWEVSSSGSESAEVCYPASWIVVGARTSGVAAIALSSDAIAFSSADYSGSTQCVRWVGNEILISGGGGGTKYSSNNGASFVSATGINTGGNSIIGMTYANGVWLISDNGGKVHRSTNGTSFTGVSVGASGALAVAGTRVMTANAMSAYSDNGGVSWTLSPSWVFDDGRHTCTSLASDGAKFIAATSGNSAPWNHNLFKCTSGNTWTPVTTPFTSTSTVQAIAYDEANGRWGAFSGRNFAYSANGDSWTLVPNALPSGVSASIDALAGYAGKWVVGTSDEIYSSVDGGATWVSRSSSLNYAARAVAHNGSPVQGIEIPDAPGFYVGDDGIVRSNCTASSVTAGSVALSDIVADLCDRADVPASQIDASALAGISVRGFPIARQTTADAALRELMQVFFFDLPEWGNSGDDTTKLRAVLRGGAVAVTVTDDNLVESDDDEETRAQQVEFPRKVTLTFADPDANYEPASQPAERTTENIKAVGESQISTSVVLSRTEAAVVVDRLLKTLWEEANGRINRELPEEFTRFTTSDIVSYLGKRWRLEKTELQDGSVRWDMVRDRASNATSTATGSPAPTPTPAASSTRGPTVFSAMNLPRLRSQDTTPGMYVAVCGRLAGWIGCDLYLSVDDGVTEQLVATITAPATMGTLSAALAAAGATASVSLWEGELASVTVDQLLARQNAAAITTSNVSEILQFQTATDTGTDAYDLTTLSRGVLGTTAASHLAADSFVLLDAAVVFVPLDIGLAGKTLIFRPVSIGTAPANNATYSVPFQPKFTGPQVVEAYTDDAGNVYTDDAGNNYYYEVPSP